MLFFMGNRTSQSEFILLGLSDFQDSSIPISMLILLIYVATLAGNLLIVSLVVSESHLQTPMYFFLSNLASLDIFSSSISASHLFFDIFTGNRLILYSTCITQVFFFSWFVSTESFMLEIMSYDRYVAICHPLRYSTMMSFQLSVQLAFSIWVLNFACCLVHTLCVLRLAFPDPTTIPGLFCELYQLIQLSSSDTFLNYLLLYTEVSCFSVTGFFITFLSYVYIFKTILRIKIKEGRRKAYSTCSSHLTVVFIFYGTAFINYLHPKTKDLLSGRLTSLFYTVVTPFLNPIIYSLRNAELKSVLQKTLDRMGSNDQRGTARK